MQASFYTIFIYSHAYKDKLYFYRIVIFPLPGVPFTNLLHMHVASIKQYLNTKICFLISAIYE